MLASRKHPLSSPEADHRFQHKHRKILSHFNPLPAILRSQNQQSSPLLRLPRELRDLIIEEALPSCEGQEFRLWYGKGTLPSGLLGACHQLREETVELFFKINTICVTGRQNLEDMVDMGNGRHHRLINKVRLIPCERSCFERAVELAAHHAADCDLDPGTVWVPYFDHPRCLYERSFASFAGFVNYAGITEPYDKARYKRLWDSAHWSLQGIQMQLLRETQMRG